MTRRNKIGLGLEITAGIVMAIVAFEAYPQNPIWGLSATASLLALLSASVFALRGSKSS